MIERARVSYRDDVIVESLSCWSDMSRRQAGLCALVCGDPSSSEICRRAHERLQAIETALIVEEGHPEGQSALVCCCWSGAKLLVLMGHEKTHVAYCRSRIPDEKHLRAVERRTKRSYSDIRKEWQRLPVFGEEFVARVLEELETKSQVPDTTKESARKLAGAYDRFEMDVVAFSLLQTLIGGLRESAAQRLPSGAVTVRCVFQSDEQPVVRIITRPFLDDRSFDGELPIFGFAVETSKGVTLEECLQDATVQKLNEVLLQGAGGMRWEPIPLEHEGCWSARVDFAFEQDPGQEWRGWAKDIIGAALHLGAGTVFGMLMTSISHKDVAECLPQLAPFCVESIYPYAPTSWRNGSGRTSRETSTPRPILACRVLPDLAKAVDEIGDKNVDIVSKRLRQRSATRLLEAAARYDILTPAPGRMLDSHSLAADLRTGGSMYQERLERGLIQSWLKAGMFAKSRVEECLQRDSRATMSAMLVATRSGTIRLETDPGKSAWRAVLDFAESHIDQRRRDRLDQQIFEAAAPLWCKLLLATAADTLGPMAAVLSLGIIWADRVMIDIRKGGWRWFVESRVRTSEK